MEQVAIMVIFLILVIAHVFIIINAEKWRDEALESRKIIERLDRKIAQCSSSE